MLTEEIKNLVQQLLNDKFATLQKRITQLEQELGNMKMKQCYSEKINSTVLNEFSEIQTQFKRFLLDIEQTKNSANTILEQTDKRIREAEKIKSNQAKSLENLKQTVQRAEQPQVLQYTQNTQSQQQQQYQSSSQYSQQNSWIQESQISRQMVFKTANGKKFHKDGCEWLKHSQIPIQRQQAMKEGLEACLICRP